MSVRPTRTHLELFARYLEDERGNGPATVHRRLSTGFRSLPYSVAFRVVRIQLNPSPTYRAAQDP